MEISEEEKLIFLSRIDKSGGLDSCHLWTSGFSHGYGRFRCHDIDVRAHRLMWELTNGPIPEEIEVCHTCDNPPCCNIKHLWLGTQTENNIDAVKKGRWNGYRDRVGLFPSQEQKLSIRNLYFEDELSLSEVCRRFNLGRFIVWKILSQIPPYEE